MSSSPPGDARQDAHDAAHEHVGRSRWQDAWKHAWKADWKWVVVALLVILALDVTSLWNKSTTYDEGAHYRFGYEMLMGVVARPDEQRMPVSMLNALPLWLAAGGSDARLEPPDTRLSRALSRLPTVFASLALAFVVYALAQALYGGRAGLLALFLYALSPDFLANARFATTDLYAAAGALGSVACLFFYLRSPGWPWAIATGLALGFAQISKQTSILLLPIFVLTVLVHWLWARTRERPAEVPAAAEQPVGRTVGQVVAAGCVMLVVIAAAYRFEGLFEPIGRHAGSVGPIGAIAEIVPALPLPVPRIYVETFIRGFEVNESGDGRADAYLLGHYNRLGWWYYYPVALLFKTPLPLFVLGVLAAISFVRDRGTHFDRDVYVLVPGGVLIVFLTFFVTAQIGVRYLLPGIVFGLVFVARLAGEGAKPASRGVRWAIGVCLAWYALSTLSWHPHYLSYFNELVPDRTRLYRYLADSNVDWGQNDLYRDAYLEAHPDVHYAPEEPTEGLVLVGVNQLIGLERDRERYRWLRERFEPIGQVAYSWLLFDVPAGSLTEGSTDTRGEP